MKAVHDKVIRQFPAELFATLYGRWLDEQDYEDVEDYKEVLQSRCPFAIQKITRRPFAVFFTANGFEYRIRATRTEVKYGWRKVK